MHVRHWKKSIKGHRAENQDQIFANDDLGLYIVADGVGGVAGGRMAAMLAIQSFVSKFKQVNNTIKNYRDLRSVLLECLDFSRRVIINNANQCIRLKYMSTTFSVLALKAFNYFNKGSHIHGEILHVGDSSIFGISKKVFADCEKLTKDDVNHDGSLSNYLPNYGVKDLFFPQVRSVILEPNEEYNFLLCSDGVTMYFNNEEIFQCAKEQKNSKLVDYFIENSMSRGGADNASIINVSINSGVEISPKRSGFYQKIA